MGRIRSIGIALAVLTVVACADVRSGATVHNRKEIPPGPGLLSGAAGEFAILRGRPTRTADDPNAGGGDPSR